MLAVGWDVGALAMSPQPMHSWEWPQTRQDKQCQLVCLYEREVTLLERMLRCASPRTSTTQASSPRAVLAKVLTPRNCRTPRTKERDTVHCGKLSEGGAAASFDNWYVDPRLDEARVALAKTERALSHYEDNITESSWLFRRLAGISEAHQCMAQAQGLVQARCELAQRISFMDDDHRRLSGTYEVQLAGLHKVAAEVLAGLVQAAGVQSLPGDGSARRQSIEEEPELEPQVTAATVPSFSPTPWAWEWPLSTGEKKILLADIFTREIAAKEAEHSLRTQTGVDSPMPSPRGTDCEEVTVGDLTVWEWPLSRAEKQLLLARTFCNEVTALRRAPHTSQDARGESFTGDSLAGQQPEAESEGQEPGQEPMARVWDWVEGLGDHLTAICCASRPCSRRPSSRPSLAAAGLGLAAPDAGLHWRLA